MNTIKERKNLVIEIINRHEDWIDDFEEMLELIARKRQEVQHKQTEQELNNDNWRNYAEPIKEKTELDEIMASQNYDIKGFLEGCENEHFFQEMTDDEFFKMIEELS